MSFIKVVSQKVLANDWGTLTKYEFNLRRRDGTWQRQTREAYDRGMGAVALLYDPETTCVLLTRQFRLPVWLNGGQDGLIEAPAGLLEGADPAERMRAELMEETGYDVSTLEHLYDVFMSPSSVTEHLVFFTGTYSQRNRVTAGGGLKEEGEDIETLHIPLTEALAMISTGAIRDAKTIILLQHLALRQTG